MIYELASDTIAVLVTYIKAANDEFVQKGLKMEMGGDEKQAASAFGFTEFEIALKQYYHNT